MSSTLELNVDELELDLKNPRFAGLTSQREALEKIVVNQGIKLVNLAEDISLNGLSPAHRMLVMKAPGKKSSSYIALDGNRRLAALRVLSNPSVLDGMTGVGDITARRLRNWLRHFLSQMFNRLMYRSARMKMKLGIGLKQSIRVRTMAGAWLGGTVLPPLAIVDTHPH